MPELPEVETIASELNRKIKGKKIKEAEIRLPKMTNIPPPEFAKALKGHAISGVRRRAKLIIVSLSGDLNMLIHLKLTGQLIYEEKGAGRQFKHTHAVFYFAGGSRLVYNDMRQFGYIRLASDKELQKMLDRENFGPEPLSAQFTLKSFGQMLGEKGRQKIKPLLMNQNFIAGIGNIYASEICFFAKVSPDRTVSSLTDKEIADIFRGIKKILPLAIKYKGTSAENYVTTSGEGGNFQKMLKVYGRAGKKCPRDGGEIRRISLAGRGTFYCQKCQK